MDLWLEDWRAYGPTPEQLGALLPRGATFQVVDSFGELAYEIRLRSHADKVALLDALASFDARDPRVRRVAEHLTAPARQSPSAAVEALHAAVRDGVAFAPELVETFQHTLRTIETARGDCDDSTRALVALARSIGIPARLATLGTPPTHVYPELHATGTWLPAEPSIPAQLGEHPLAAAARLGIQTRPDIR